MAIESILAQSFKDWNLYVVGDGCTDRTADVVKKMASISSGRIHWFNMSKNHGGGHWRHLRGDSGASARNYGFYSSKEPYIAYLDDDDRYHSNHLELLYKTIKSDNYDFVYSKGAFLYPHRGAKPMIVGANPPRYQGLGTNAIMHTRSIANRVLFNLPPNKQEHGMKKGLWRSSKEALAAHDWEMVQRFLNTGARYKFIDQVTYEAFWDWRQDDFAKGVRTPRYETTGNRNNRIQPT